MLPRSHRAMTIEACLRTLVRGCAQVGLAHLAGGEFAASVSRRERTGANDHLWGNGWCWRRFMGKAEEDLRFRVSHKYLSLLTWLVAYPSRCSSSLVFSRRLNSLTFAAAAV